MQQLKSGSLLQGGKYKIEKVLGQGGFGITYLATQELLDRKVCIKEFFYKEYCERDEATSHVSLGTQSSHELVERFMNKFLKEARTISQLDHRNIIKIHDIFKENNTAYYVMDYVEGESLNEMVSRRGALPEKEVVAYIERVADALKYIHQRNINHLDIKPSNIMIRQGDYRVILIDFGLSKQYDAQGGQTSTTPVGISHGYAPMEQYKQGGVSTFSPQTDIYALGATLYKLVTGNTPPQAMDILDEGLPPLPSSLSSSVVETIKKAMQPRKVDRPNSIDDFLSGLNVLTQNADSVQQGVKVQLKQNEDEATIVLNQPGNKERKQQSQYVDDRPKPTISFEPVEGKKEKKVGFFLIILVVSCFILYGKIGSNFSDNNTDVPVESQTRTAESIYKEACTYYENKDYLTAIPLLEEAADMGYAPAQTLMGYCYSNGEGVSKNDTMAFEWTKKAADQNEITASYNLGLFYFYGNGVAKNVIKSKEWMEKAAAQGYEAAKKFLKENDFRVKRKQNVSQSGDRHQNVSSGIINGHEYVDLGLSVKWATCNVGASSPEEYGNYYAWSDIETRAEYNSIYSAWFHENMNIDIGGNSLYDAARANWSGSWRLPTKAEFQELLNNCKWNWTTQGGKRGYKVVGRNDNSIFLPAAGYRSGSSLYTSGVAGYYWSSTPNSNDFGIAPYILKFDDDEMNVHFRSWGEGLNVRPVSK